MYKGKQHLKACLSLDIGFNDKRYIIAQKASHLLLYKTISLLSID